MIPKDDTRMNSIIREIVGIWRRSQTWRHIQWNNKMVVKALNTKIQNSCIYGLAKDTKINSPLILNFRNY